MTVSSYSLSFSALFFSLGWHTISVVFSKFNISSSANVEIVAAPINALISGSLMRVQPSNTWIEADGSGSGDPNFPNPTSAVKLHWFIYAINDCTTFNCASISANAVAASNLTSLALPQLTQALTVPILQLPPNTLSPGSYLIILQVSSNFSSKLAGPLYVQMTAAAIPSPNPSYPIFSASIQGPAILPFGQALKLAVLVTLNQPSSSTALVLSLDVLQARLGAAGLIPLQLRWSEPSGHIIPFSSPLLLSASEANTLVISSDALLPGTLYTLAVNFLESSVSANFTVRVASPPLPGECSVSPSQGESLYTYFNFACSGWSPAIVSDVSLNPLTYEFGYLDSNNNSVWFSSPSQSSLLNVLIPVVGILSLVARISDSSLNSASSPIGLVTVTPSQHSYIPGLIWPPLTFTEPADPLPCQAHTLQQLLIPAAVDLGYLDVACLLLNRSIQYLLTGNNDTVDSSFLSGPCLISHRPALFSGQLNLTIEQFQLSLWPDVATNMELIVNQSYLASTTVSTLLASQIFDMLLVFLQLPSSSPPFLAIFGESGTGLSIFSRILNTVGKQLELSTQVLQLLSQLLDVVRCGSLFDEVLVLLQGFAAASTQGYFPSQQLAVFNSNEFTVNAGASTIGLTQNVSAAQLGFQLAPSPLSSNSVNQSVSISQSFIQLTIIRFGNATRRCRPNTIGPFLAHCF